MIAKREKKEITFMKNTGLNYSRQNNIILSGLKFLIMANVLSLVPYRIFPAKFGGQKCIAHFNEYFSEYHSLYCITVEENKPSFASYEVINTLGNSRLRYINIFYFGRIKKIIRENNISHIIIEHPYFGWLALLLKRFCKVKLIVHSHNIEAERFKTIGKWWWKLLWYYERFVHRHADFTFCITEEDRQYFLKQYSIAPEKISLITYGIPWNSLPPVEDHAEAKSRLLKKYSLAPGTVFYLFNGAFDYKPNLDALENILERINPLLIESDINYKIFICGKNLPVKMNELKEYAERDVIYAGFVEDISLYFKAADIFINPVTDGGGIKTKLVEALGYNLTAVSTKNGATGVDEKICNGKLILCENNDWQAFADKMLEATDYGQSVPPEFFNHFYWDNIAEKASLIVLEMEN
ncbi:MAG: glycosyltransferase family 4 protein [Bacteroidota bacterium]|nr:glycosyltransferase family 4 protein [Bacteroidota bacterium]